MAALYDLCSLPVEVTGEVDRWSFARAGPSMLPGCFTSTSGSDVVQECEAWSGRLGYEVAMVRGCLDVGAIIRVVLH